MAMKGKKNQVLKAVKKKSWNEWVAANMENIDFLNGSIYHIRRPNWHGSHTKGGSAYDFSDLQLVNISIYDAFAEGLNISNSNLLDVSFEEGDFSRANFENCRFENCKFNKTIFTNANFSGSTLINCNLNRVNLSGANFDVEEISETVVYGISTWDLQISEKTKQSKLVIEKTYELYSDLIAEGRIPMMVDDIELAQFIYFLSNHKKMRASINVLNNRGVLLLGRFNNGGLNRLYNIREWLIKKNYLPMIFDFERPMGLDLTETIVTMSGLSKFIIADLLGSSVPQELHAILSVFSKPVIAYHDQKPYSMFADLMRKNKFVHFTKFNGSVDDLIEKLSEKIIQAEKDFNQLIIDLAAAYPDK
jgi:uncharacterized protein YjbI with pentapeptide repeats